MSTPDNKATSSCLLKLDDLPKNEEGAVFAEPWHAEVFSIVHLLVDRGHINVSEWADILGAVIKEESDNEAYYQCWLMALERIILDKGLMDHALLTERKEAWDRAARATPHGEPIVLGCDEN